MANHLAIATATEALRLRLNDAIRSDLPGVQVAAKRPEAADGQSQSQVSIFLYRVSPNAALRNADLPTRDTSGRVIHRPTAALDLHYLLSFAGDEQQLIPQRMLGLAVASLHAAPGLSRSEIETASQGETWLMNSNLADEIESVKFSMSTITVDDLSKVWSIFFQIPYQLSAGYEASVVLIESELAVREPLPVRERGVDALPIRQPVIEGVNGGQQISGDAALEIEITGKRLRGPATFVSFDGGDQHQVTPERDTRLVVPTAISTQLGAGVHGVQVIHEILIGTPRVPHRAVESNVFPFLLRPSIAANLNGTDIDVAFVPPVRADQRVRLLLTEILDPAPAGRDLRFVTLQPNEEDTDGPWADLTFDASAVEAGVYLVRAQVDGAESLLTVTRDGGPPQPGPTVMLP